MLLSLHTTRDGTRTVVSAAGDLDVASAPLLRRALDDAAAAGPALLVLDLST